VVGRSVEFNGYKLYLVSVYAPCCGKSKPRLAANMTILNEVEKLVISMKAKRHEVIVSGDLNFIRDNFLDADGGSPEIYKEQLEWIDCMAKYCGMFDAMRFLLPNERLYSWSRPADKIQRRLDYIFCSRKMLECACDTSIVAVPQTDHQLLVIKFKLGEEEIGGPGLWRHNDEHLKTDEYQCLMSKCIDTAIVDRADEQDPAVTWEWIKFQRKVSSVKYSKDLARMRRDNLIKAEQRYAFALETHSADLIEAQAELQKFKCIDKGIVDRPDEQDPTVTWEWIKFQQKVSSLKYSKDLA
jgi:hypothetical protein